MFNRLSVVVRSIPDEVLAAFPHEILFAARVKAGLSQAEAAVRAGFSQQYWQQLESGKRDASVEIWRRAFDGIECDILLLARPRRHLGEWRARRALEGRWCARSVTRARRDEDF